MLISDTLSAPLWDSSHKLLVSSLTYLPASTQVEVVREGLGFKSCWSKRAPLKLSSPEGVEMLNGRASIYIWALSGAHKEQWYNALARGSNSVRAHQLKGMEDAYLQFSDETSRHGWSSTA